MAESKINIANMRSIAISGILTLNMHALNNEGTEGNVLETRMVEVVDKDGNIYSVNAISGDMFKHIQYEHLVDIAIDENLPLCAGCKIKNPNRINIDPDFAKKGNKSVSDSSSQIIDDLVKKCIGDDIEGVLITSYAGSKKSVPRKSAIEFSWVIGIPDQIRTESFFHVKFDRKNLGKGHGGEHGQNIGQNIFHRPGSSGRYALVVNADLDQIGINQISGKAVLNNEEINQRKAALLRSIIRTFVKIKGAQRNTQNPHIVNFEGVISVSTESVPAPAVSPLFGVEEITYIDQVERISDSLNKIGKKDAIQIYKFSNIAEFVEIMQKFL